MILQAKFLEPKLKKGFTSEEINLFIEHGIFYGVHVSPKLIALSEGLVVEHKDLLLDGFSEPYQLPSQEPELIAKYFQELKEQKNLDLDLGSLVLADTTVPEGFEGKKILNPTKLNPKLEQLSVVITRGIRTRGMSTDPVYVVSTDTDSPHRLLLSESRKTMSGYPLTPGLTVCGSTAKMAGFDFKYIYRTGLIAQTLGNNIISSRIANNFSPFTFFGMLSPFGYVNKAIDTGFMDKCRYEGNIDLRTEFLFQYENCIKKMVE